ncbi:MAG: hypothetical protein GY771_00700 [bacterium]|nr:hypothetical protein [bacterium]
MDVYELRQDYFLFRTPETDFNRNIYLRRYRGDNREINMLMDPGSRADFEQLLATLKKTIGDVNKTGLIFVSHQDPDLTSSIYPLMQHSPARLLTSDDTWRILQTIGLDEKRFTSTDSFPGGTARLATGQYIRFIPAYFCHFRGAQMLFDEETRILFTGDFCSGLLTKDDDDIYATEKSWKGVKTFHEIYMPSNKIIKATIERIRAFPPTPEIIAPQHGDIIKGELVELFLSKLEELPVGIDIIGKPDLSGDVVLRIFNKTLRVLKETDEKVFDEFITSLRDGGKFTPFFTLQGDKLDQIKVGYSAAVDAFMSAVKGILPVDIEGTIKISLVTEIQELGLEVPDSLITGGEALVTINDLFEKTS